MDADWRALRSDVPWVGRSPSKVVREHLRFTTQPLDEPDARHKLGHALELVDGLENMLMFATDYPHWDFDRPDLVSRRLPAAWTEKVMSENARALYGLPPRMGRLRCVGAGEGLRNARRERQRRAHPQTSRRERMIGRGFLGTDASCGSTQVPGYLSSPGGPPGGRIAREA